MSNFHTISMYFSTEQPTGMNHIGENNVLIKSRGMVLIWGWDYFGEEDAGVEEHQQEAPHAAEGCRAGRKQQKAGREQKQTQDYLAQDWSVAQDLVPPKIN